MIDHGAFAAMEVYILRVTAVSTFDSTRYGVGVPLLENALHFGFGRIFSNDSFPLSFGLACFSDYPTFPRCPA